MSAAQYGKPFADRYDIFYKDKPYAAEAKFIDELIRAKPQSRKVRLLELACGTGSHAFEFERLGYQVVATDSSPGMIDVARTKASEAGSAVSFRVADMCSSEVGEGEFDIIVCLFDSIGYLIENDAIMACLRNARKRIAKNGSLIIESWHAGAMLSRRDPIRVRRWSATGTEIVRISETACDLSRQICTVQYQVIVTHTDGRSESFKEQHRNRYFLKKEMDLLLYESGFKTEACYSGYSSSQILTEETWHLLHVAEPL